MPSRDNAKRPNDRTSRRRRSACSLAIAAAAACTALVACGGGDATSASVSSATGTSLKAGYKAAKWSSSGNMTVTYSGDCSMTITTTDLPNHAMPTYYLQPTDSSYPTEVTSNDTGPLSIQPNIRTQTPATYTINICPSKASTVTATNMGVIGVMISGGELFNAFEAGGVTPALTDNVSVAAPDGSTASFLDTCNAHYAPKPDQSGPGGQYHYHAVSPCVTAEVDSDGGSSHLIGVADDGFPIYGGRDINGQVIAVSQLDACNGITSATPEFPNGVYHYVLPEGVTDKFSSLNCYSGTVSATMALAQLRSVCRGNRIASSTRANSASRPKGVPLAALRSDPSASARRLAES